MGGLNIEFEDLLARIRSTIKLRKMTVGIALLIVVWLLAAGLVPYPEQTTEITFVVLVWFLSIFVFEFLINRQKSISGLNNLYFGYEILELFLMVWIVYNAGGAEWMGAMFFLFVIVYGNIILSRRRGFILSTVAVVFYLSLIISEYFGFIPFKEFFPMEPGLYKNLTYLLITIPFVIFAFYLIGLATSLFTGLLKKRTSEIEDARAVLAVKVKARTRELEELAETREKIIEEKTKELRDKVEELERFHSLAVGRELKMIELKKEIKKLKEAMEKAGKKEQENNN